MIRPMLASLADAPLDDPLLVYEPKYDGIRAIAEVGGRGTVPGTGSRTGTRPPAPVAFIAFDLLRHGTIDLRDRPLTARRAELERVFRRTGSPLLRISTQVRGNGRDLYREALDRGWEGLIAKHADSVYKSGKRTPDWRKLKIVHEQEFIVGGWTEPRQTRAYFGALLLGVYEAPGTRHPASGTRHKHPAPSTQHAAPNRLAYVGHTATGINEKELA